MLKISLFLPFIWIFFFVFFSSRAQLFQYYDFYDLEVLDGDTVKVRSSGEKIRLYGIDAPELSQKSFDGKWVGKRSKNYLVKLMRGKRLSLKVVGYGYYGRTLGLLFSLPNKVSLNYKMLEQGQALLYGGTKYSSLSQKYRWKRAFLQAFNNRLGLWKTKGFYSPKVYRKKVRALNAKGIYIKL